MSLAEARKEMANNAAGLSVAEIKAISQEAHKSLTVDSIENAEELTPEALLKASRAELRRRTAEGVEQKEAEMRFQADVESARRTLGDEAYKKRVEAAARQSA